MLGEVGFAVDRFVADVRRCAPDHIAAVYLVGGVALGDFSQRQSNVDLVVVADPELSGDQQAQLQRAAKSLQRGRRPAEMWLTTWAEIADGPGPSRSPSTASPVLETPLTRALLRHDAIALFGPDWPVVQFDASAFKHWCVERLKALLVEASGLMLMRRQVSDMVLEAARLAQCAATGRAFSKLEAGETAGSMVSPHFRRILSDASGYRAGANTSMYWGPFERKYDARVLLQNFLDAAQG